MKSSSILGFAKRYSFIPHPSVSDGYITGHRCDLSHNLPKLSALV
ncbi:hypothetical protein BIFDEN_00352 [Bifidobacterium dentium ATCC 27678]|uniref:Uncharacterized protein n=1 Tax=Bifidobacterium dentium (strain ATCC 27534 / DSM 20436 / JCM 1195 / Bd1) TaxID=401473 RepID=D2Q8G6_BIFDB|nr:Hypothetical protein BDP_0427 [Bifidobacterium dentium Bd1]EDT44552.1 hypothetical protein BIFDEN_00352 [Bifidobacterium dentium ATCC 27678]